MPSAASEKALVSTLAQMYIQGVSTRKVKAITEQLCGHSFSASTVSEINKKLDEELEIFATRQLEGDYPYLILDARYEKVRSEGAVRSQASSSALVKSKDGGIARSVKAMLLVTGGVGVFSNFFY